MGVGENLPSLHLEKRVEIREWLTNGMRDLDTQILKYGADLNQALGAKFALEQVLKAQEEGAFKEEEEALSMEEILRRAAAGEDLEDPAPPKVVKMRRKKNGSKETVNANEDAQGDAPEGDVS